MENTKINVLGTEYRVETHKISEDNYLEKKQARRMGHYREFRLMRLELPKRCKVKLIDRRGKHYDL